MSNTALGPPPSRQTPIRLCTYFDRNYLPQALALYRSLERHVGSFRMTMLCLDGQSLRIAHSLLLPNADPLSADDLIHFQPRLADAQADRGTIEFYYACTPWLVAHAMEAGECQEVTYLDADMFFFSDIRDIYEEAHDAPVMIVEHDSGDERAEAAHGRFNVCLLHFRPTHEGRSCLRWWGEATLQSTALGEGVWGDQKYLDEFPHRFPATHVIAHPGAAPAPWNISHKRVERTDGELLVDGRPLLAYHFARFLVLGRRLFIPIRREWLPRRVLDLVYRPYMAAIRQAIEEISTVDPAYRVGYTRHNFRGVLLGGLAGRMFYEGTLGMRRLGVYIPSGRPEAMALRDALRRRGSAASAVEH